MMSAIFSEVAELLEQVDADVTSLTADGMYDGEAVYEAVTRRCPDAVDAEVFGPLVAALSRYA